MIYKGMKKSIKDHLFQCFSYREFLREVLEAHGSERGYRKKLAESAGCQPAYLSHVMAEKADLTPEHAENLCLLWEFSETEADYFFHLVLRGRAGTPALQKRLKNKLLQIRERWAEENTLKGKEKLTEAERSSVYYAHWLNTAIHLFLTIEGMNTIPRLADHFKLPEEEVLSILEELKRVGLVEERKGEWLAKHLQLYVSNKNFFAEVHHKNWRSYALETRRSQKEKGFRFTSAHTIAREDFNKIKNLIKEMISNSRQVIDPSPEEMGACLIVDYFEI